MGRDFSEHFVIIYDKFTKIQSAQDKKTSVLALGVFLGHGHDGRVKAWKKGQWPSAEDCWTLSKVFGFDLYWLVTGEGDPFETPGQDEPPTSVPQMDASQPPPPGAYAIPLIGFGACGMQGWYGTMHIPVPVEPPAWHDGMLAVIASGESMLPAGISHGHICYCDTTKTPVKEEAVYIELNDNTGAIKLFMGRTERAGKEYVLLHGWLDKKDDDMPQKPYSLEVLASNVRHIAPVIYVRRRL